MSEFKNVSVVRAVNVYFDGAVTSRTLRFKDGSLKTLGLMQPGDYVFNTDKRELMEIQLGEVEILLDGESNWKHYSAGQSFEVPASSSFRIRAICLTDYCCSFLD